MTFIFNNEIFYPAFFGYTNLPDSIEIGNRKLIPVKSLCLKYHGTITNGLRNDNFSCGNIRTLCRELEIQLHRPIRGLYCVEERYLKFFDALYQLHIKKVESIKYFCFFTNFEMIKNMFYEVMV